MDWRKVIPKEDSDWLKFFEMLSTCVRPCSEQNIVQRFGIHSDNPDVPICWDRMLSLLMEDEPLLQDRQIIFKPLLLHLPDYLQTKLLQCILLYRNYFQSELLRKFVTTMKNFAFDDENEWRGYILHKLENFSTVKESRLPPFSDLCKFSDVNEFLVKNIEDELAGKNGECSSLMPNRHSNAAACEDFVANVDNCDVTATSQTPSGERKRKRGEECRPNEEIGNSQQKRKSLLSEESMMEPSQEQFQDSTILSCVDTGESEDPLMMEVCKLKEHWHSSLVCHPSTGAHNLGDDGDSNSDCVFCLLRLHVSEVERVFFILELDKLSEASMAVACQDVCGLNLRISFATSLAFAKACLLPTLAGLTHPASRLLVSTLSAFSKQFPVQTIRGVLLPSLLSCSNFVADLNAKVVNETVEGEEKSLFLREFLKTKTCWMEPNVAVLQILVDPRTPKLHGDILQLFVDGVSSYYVSSSSPSYSLKVAKLLLAVIGKYGAEFTSGQVAILKNVAQNNDTFLKKSLLSALNKLK